MITINELGIGIEYKQNEQYSGKKIFIIGLRKGPTFLVYCTQPYFVSLHWRLFPGFKLVTFQSRDNDFTVASRLPLKLQKQSNIKTLTSTWLPKSLT